MTKKLTLGVPKKHKFCCRRPSKSLKMGGQRTTVFLLFCLLGSRGATWGAWGVPEWCPETIWEVSGWPFGAIWSPFGGIWIPFWWYRAPLGQYFASPGGHFGALSYSAVSHPGRISNSQSPIPNPKSPNHQSPIPNPQLGTVAGRPKASGYIISLSLSIYIYILIFVDFSIKSYIKCRFVVVLRKWHLFVQKKTNRLFQNSKVVVGLFSSWGLELKLVAC